MLLTYLNFEEVHFQLSLVSRRFRKLIVEDPRIDSTLWQSLFLQEFMYISYPDHQRFEADGESYRAYFIRSFQAYKHMRELVRGIIEESNARIA